MSSSAMRDVLCRSAMSAQYGPRKSCRQCVGFRAGCACRSVGCQYAIDVHVVARATKRGRDRRIPQLAGDTRQRAELLLAAGAFRKQQQKNDIDRFPVNGVVIDRLLEASEQAERSLGLLKSRMRYGHAAADAGGSERLALEQCSDDGVARQVEFRSGIARELRQQFFLVG